MTRIAFITSEAETNLADDDLVLRDALATRGIDVVPWVWRAPQPVALDAALMRSCWDYHHEPLEFHAFLELLDARGLLVWNPINVLRWNLDKTYLKELAERGALVPRTVWCSRGETSSLLDVLARAGLDEVVIKPTISLSAHDTSRSSRASAPADQKRFAELLAEKSLLVQEFVPEIAEGEISMVFVDGVFSHAVRKVPARGDFRVQSSLGGTAAPTTARTEWITTAQAILRQLPPLLYARVDVVPVRDQLLWMELEALDPVLFFRFAPNAAERMADVIRSRLVR